MKKIFLIVLILFVLIINPSHISAQDSEKFEYKITTSSEDWKKLTTRDEMVAALRIEQDVLDTMTTLELVEAVFDYPLLINIHLYSSPELALKQFRLDCDAFRELITRPDAGNVLLDYTKEFANNSYLQMSGKILLSNQSISDTISKNEILLKSQFVQLTAYYTTVTTPNGSSVTVIVFGELYSDDYYEQLNEAVIIAYPNATYVSTSTSRYNCHSYAWYSSSTSNIYWMNDPSTYMSDGSYTRVYAALGATKLFYPVGDHSARFYDVYSNNLYYATVISKWGTGPVMIHNPYYSPYSITGKTMWQ